MAFRHDVEMDNSIWQRIQEARADVGLKTTQTAIAHDLGLSQSSVQKWAAGKGLRLTHALEIAEKCGVCVEWLYTGRGPKHPIRIVSDDLNVHEFLDSLPSPVLEEVVEFARFRAKSGQSD